MHVKAVEPRTSRPLNVILELAVRNSKRKQYTTGHNAMNSHYCWMIALAAHSSKASCMCCEKCLNDMMFACSHSVPVIKHFWASITKQNLSLWERFIETSLGHCYHILPRVLLIGWTTVAYVYHASHACSHNFFMRTALSKTIIWNPRTVCRAIEPM